MKLSKAQALEIWNNNRVVMAAAIGVTPQAISLWKSLLTEVQTDRVIAAAWRGGISSKLDSLKKIRSTTCTLKPSPQGQGGEIKTDERDGYEGNW